jgi:hypothetical protein
VKGFPADPGGPLGPWLKRVNATVAMVRVGDSREAVEDALGPPDEVRTGGVGPSAAFQDLMEDVAGGPTLVQYGSKAEVEAVLVYKDPYRSRRRYIFVVNAGHVTDIHQEAVVE